MKRSDQFETPESAVLNEALGLFAATKFRQVAQRALRGAERGECEHYIGQAFMALDMREKR